jgi:hypothetical protein
MPDQPASSHSSVNLVLRRTADKDLRPTGIADRLLFWVSRYASLKIVDNSRFSRPKRVGIQAMSGDFYNRSILLVFLLIQK